jgi:hypothetical protein
LADPKPVDFATFKEAHPDLFRGDEEMTDATDESPEG